MPIYWDGNKIIPAPFVSINKTYQFAENGIKTGSVYQISLRSKLVAYKGSPSSTGTFWNTTGYPQDETITHDERLKSLLQKEKAIRRIFTTDGKLLEIQPWDGSAATKFNCRVKEIRFPEGPWYDYVDYEIILESDFVIGEEEFTDQVQNLEDNWSIELEENLQTFRVTHNVGAIGKAYYNSAGALVREPWQNARMWVTGHLGLELGIFNSGVWQLPSYYAGYNRQFSENIEEWNGRYTVTESWILSSGTAVEEFNISTRTSVDQGKTSVSIEGNIRGFNSDTTILNIGPARFVNAEAKFAEVQDDLLGRAQSYAGLTLNPQPVTGTIGRNPITGTISYAYEYDTRATNLIPGALSESIQVSDNNPNDVFASIGVLGRLAGPILQDIGARTIRTRTVEMSYVVTTPTGTTPAELLSAKPDTNAVGSGFAPTSYSQLFLARDTETFEVKTGRGSKLMEFAWEL